MLLQCFVFFLLFSDFYSESYRPEREEKLQKDAAAEADLNNNAELAKNKED